MQFSVSQALCVLYSLHLSATAAPVGDIAARAINAQPAVGQNFADPGLIYAEGAWWAFATRTIGSPIHIQVAKSTDFNTWAVLSDTSGAQWNALQQIPAWANQQTPNTWGPDVSFLSENPNKYIMYYSATLANDPKTHCIGAATSSSIAGPYQPTSDQPLICPTSQGGAIDPSGFVDPATGNRYIVYKIDGDSIGHGDAQGSSANCHNTVAPIVPTPLLLQQVANDGVTLIGSPMTLLDNAGVSDDGIVEAPNLVRAADGTYTLFFSSGCFTGPDYTVSYATAPALTGPYTRGAQPLLKTGGAQGMQGAGGATVWNDAQHIVFHNGPWGDRVMMAGEVNIQGGTVTI